MKFTINTTYSDSYDGFLVPSIASSPTDSYPIGDLESGVNGFQLLPETGNTSVSGAPVMSTEYATSNLSTNNPNTQQKYRLRLYDKSVSPTGIANSGNYSETAFYAVRDNTPPNWGGNGLAGTGSNAPILAGEMLLKFDDSTTVYDTNAYPAGFTPTSNGVSRFFAASTAIPLKYKFNDNGITGNTGVNPASAIGYASSAYSDTSLSYAGL